MQQQQMHSNRMTTRNPPPAAIPPYTGGSFKTRNTPSKADSVVAAGELGAVLLLATEEVPGLFVVEPLPKPDMDTSLPDMPLPDMPLPDMPLPEPLPEP